jgi:hypothetical protein
MQNERDELIEEFIITTWDALFRVPQTRLGVTDGGYCSVFTSGHDLLERTREAIQSRLPDFWVTSQQAYGTTLPELTDRADLEPENLKELGREYLQRLGEFVGADLAANEPLVAEYGRMLEAYVQGEREFNAPSTPSA